MFVSSTRERVLIRLAEGRSQADVARSLGLARSTVAYHARQARAPDPKFRRRYDWDAVQAYYEAGHSVTDCVRHFGFSRKTFHDACRAGRVKTRPQAMPIAHLLVVGRRTNRKHLRQRLISAGLKALVCEGCGLDTWRGAPIGLQLHHVNGDGLDNRLENLQILCPNCHAQTENWGGRNKGRRLGGAARGQDGGMTNEHPENTEDETAGAPAEDEGPDAAELDQDPAYEPQDESLKDLKGG